MKVIAVISINKEVELDWLQNQRSIRKKINITGAKDGELLKNLVGRGLLKQIGSEIETTFGDRCICSFMQLSAQYFLPFVRDCSSTCMIILVCHVFIWLHPLPDWLNQKWASNPRYAKEFPVMREFELELKKRASPFSVQRLQEVKPVIYG